MGWGCRSTGLSDWPPGSLEGRGAGRDVCQASLQAGQRKKHLAQSWTQLAMEGGNLQVHQDGHLGGSGLGTRCACPTLCDPIDGRPPGSPVPGILQARTLEWVAISFSNA